MTTHEDRTVYDCIILGTSPVCMMEAHYQCRMGQRVLMIDSAKEAGGAWRDVELFGFEEVEIGAHIMRHWRKGYRYIENVLGIPMTRMQPEPFWILPKYGPMPTRTPCAHVWNLVLFPALGRFFSRAGLQEVLRNPKQTVFVPLVISLMWFWRFVKVGAPRARYPMGGAPRFIRRLRALLNHDSVRILTETTALEICVQESAKLVHVRTDRATLQARRLCITSQSRLNHIRGESGVLNLTPISADTKHLHMLVEDKAERLFAFARFHQDEIFNMISDISDYATHFRREKPTCKLIAAWCSSEFQDSESHVMRAFIHAKANNLIGPEARLLDYKVSVYRSTELQEQDRIAIKRQFGEFVEILETENLTENIAHYFDRWTQAN